jgi:cytochrome c-type biogenesis protein CcmE
MSRMSEAVVPVPRSVPVSRAAALKIVAAVAIIGGGVGALLYWSAQGEVAEYKYVDEVAGMAAQLTGKRLKVHGHVVDGSIEQKKGSLEYRFKIESRPPRKFAVMTATYVGLVPDTFKSGSEVVATSYIENGSNLKVVPEGIMAKCPSKYEGQAKGSALLDTGTKNDGY